jgi:hypothetical protein
MRKLFWGCAALAVAVCVLIYGAAQFAFRHPDSLVGRCVTAAFRMTSSFGPVFRTGGYLVSEIAGGTAGSDADEEICDIPDEPEPVVVAEPPSCPVEEPVSPIAAAVDPNRGRLPGKIIIDEGDEPPLADLHASPPYDLEAIGRRLDGVLAPGLPSLCEGLTDRAIAAMSQQFGSATEIVQASVAVAHRPMPYCMDEERAPRIMPRVEDPEDLEVKPPVNPIWNSFLPKGTEVGSDEESEPGKLGTDCREDPSAPVQIPGCPYPASKKCLKPAAGGEEPSEMPPAKKSKRAEPDKVKKSYDDARRSPDLMHPAIDTMEFRPSDWGRDDVALPPF